MVNSNGSKIFEGLHNILFKSQTSLVSNTFIIGCVHVVFLTRFPVPLKSFLKLMGAPLHFDTWSRDYTVQRLGFALLPIDNNVLPFRNLPQHLFLIHRTGRGLTVHFRDLVLPSIETNAVPLHRFSQRLSLLHNPLRGLIGIRHGLCLPLV